MAIPVTVGVATDEADTLAKAAVSPKFPIVGVTSIFVVILPRENVPATPVGISVPAIFQPLIPHSSLPQPEFISPVTSVGVPRFAVSAIPVTVKDALAKSFHWF